MQDQQNMTCNNDKLDENYLDSHGMTYIGLMEQSSSSESTSCKQKGKGKQIAEDESVLSSGVHAGYEGRVGSIDLNAEYEGENIEADSSLLFGNHGIPDTNGVQPMNNSSNLPLVSPELAGCAEVVVQGKSDVGSDDPRLSGKRKQLEKGGSSHHEELFSIGSSASSHHADNSKRPALYSQTGGTMPHLAGLEQLDTEVAVGTGGVPDFNDMSFTVGGGLNSHMNTLLRFENPTTFFTGSSSAVPDSATNFRQSSSNTSSYSERGSSSNIAPPVVGSRSDEAEETYLEHGHMFTPIHAGSLFGGHSNDPLPPYFEHAHMFTPFTVGSVSERLSNDPLARHYGTPLDTPVMETSPGALLRARTQLLISEPRPPVRISVLRRNTQLIVERLELMDSESLFDSDDEYEVMHLHADDLSYEELLGLDETIGNVNSGVSEEVVLALLKPQKYRFMQLGPPEEEDPCCICQEEYKDGEDLGKLRCRHQFHHECIKRWLMQKNTCPICNRVALE